jgi:hypothetical protein
MVLYTPHYVYMIDKLNLIGVKEPIKHCSTGNNSKGLSVQDLTANNDTFGLRRREGAVGLVL